MAVRALPPVHDYELLHSIGHGSYGEVWLARNILGELRAVKVIYRGRFADMRPFEREFEGIQRFEPISRSHPSQLAILHVGKNEAAGCFYYVMELADAVGNPKPETRNPKELQQPKFEYSPPKANIPVSDFGPPSEIELRSSEPYTPHTLGHDLEQHRRLPIADCVQIGLSLTTALAHLHSHGLVHRDIKPSNVIFVNGVAKLSDIGLVTEVGDSQSIVGTEGYIPPEGPGTAQADIFSLGKVLYEISTGMDRRRFAELPGDLPEWPERKELVEFNEILLKACAKDPAQRYRTAEEIRRDLTILQNGRSVKMSHRGAHLRRLAWRATVWLVASAVALGVILALSRLRLTETSHKEKLSNNADANWYYELGEKYLDKIEGTNFVMAVDCFTQAIRLDPKFAQAYARLAMTYCWTDGKWNSGWKYLPKAKELADKALKLDRTLAEPHTVLGTYYGDVEWAWSEAEREYQRAIALGASGATRLMYAEFLRKVGRMEDAFKELDEARANDKRSLAVNFRWAGFLIAAKRFPEALAQLEQLLAINPNLNVTWARAEAFRGLGDYPKAIEFEGLSRAADGQSQTKIDVKIARLKQGLNRDGTNGYWRAELANACEDEDRYEQACCYAQLGRTNEALTCLRELVQEHDRWLAFSIMSEWRLDPIRPEPGFHKILREMHFEPPSAQGARSKRS